ncbi:MAG TPA: DUF4388 domain-containing protein, partial [Candidatus Polarisedimenticolaceae bacterium]|nr:DUF4388 domain-containing protein [Candidatus Polarisedimenticolaceae bacterium]
MPLLGTLRTMSLPDLLQWLGNSSKTGTLAVERNKIRKCIVMDEGKIVGCSSDDPPERLGQYLLSQGRISEEQLRGALLRQERTRKYLGSILVELGFLTAEDLMAHLESKAEETIYSLFEWDDAIFRFREELDGEVHTFPVSLRVEDVLLRGLRRYDEVQRIREVFDDQGIVLARTGRTPPAEILGSKVGRRIYEAIDGERTVADVLLHVHGSEYLVTKLLFELHRNGLVQKVGVRRREAEPAPAQLEPMFRELVGVSA